MIKSAQKRAINILAIETSCDETAAAVLNLTNPFLKPQTKLKFKKTTFPEIITLSSIVKSQITLHSKMGGVVPEIAARAHVKNILPVIQKALSTAHCPLSTIDYIAVTAGPGLIPSLLVGVEFAKTLSLASNKPIIPVNHMLGHLYSPFGKISYKISSHQDIKSLFPNISLIVSGGHTTLVLMTDKKKYKVIGQTVDDAAGEAFDKVAKLLNLPYPGGPEVSKLAENSKNPIDFPRPMINSKNYNFSFAGLKTAVLYYVQSLAIKQLSLTAKQDICAGFQNAAIDVLISKTMRAAKEYGAKSVSLSGGVSANTSLRNKLKTESEKLKIKFFVPPLHLSTDNAEMIGMAAAFMLYNGYKPKSYKLIKADPNLTL